MNEDLQMFNELGLQPQKAFEKAPQPQTIEAKDSQLESLGEKPKWSRPGHLIERNETSQMKGKTLKNF